MNKYSSLFSEKMNSGELRSVLFSVGKTIPNEEKNALFDAYSTVASKVIKKEMDESFKYGMMTSW